MKKSAVRTAALPQDERLVSFCSRPEYGDGFFLFEFIPYGNYKVRVAPLSANIIGVVSELSGVAALNKSSGTVDMGIIITRSVPRIAAMPNNGTGNVQAP